MTLWSNRRHQRVLSCGSGLARDVAYRQVVVLIAAKAAPTKDAVDN